MRLGVETPKIDIPFFITIDSACNKSGTGKIQIKTDESYVKALLGYFKRR